MAVSVTGTFILPNGEVAANRLITMRRSQRGVVAQGLNAVLPDDVTVASDSTGQVEFDLVPGNYVGFARTANGLTANFTMAVPDVDAVDVASVINADSIPDASQVAELQAMMSAQQAQIAAMQATIDAILAGGGVTPVAPVFTVMPSLLGSTALGGTVTVDFGAASGVPAPVLTGSLVRPGQSSVTVTDGQVITIADTDQGGDLVLTVTATNSVDSVSETVTLDVPASEGEVIAGAVIGSIGEAGTIYEGFRLAAGDDFDAMPTRWNGRNLSGRYGHSPQHIGFRRTRSQDRAMYIDPAFRGARSESPVDLGYDGVSVANSVLTLTATPSPAELVPMLPTTWTDGQGDAQNRPLLISGSLKTGPSFMLSASSDFVVETRTRMEAGQIRGYWPSFWTSTFFWPDRGEIDVLEGKKTSTGTDPMTTLNNLIASATDGGSTQFLTVSQPTMPVGRMVHLVAKKVGDTLSFYDDIAEEGVMALRGSTTSALVGRLTGAHDVRIDLAVSSEWDATTFNIADWPAAVEFDWWRAWVPATAARQNEPLEVLPPVLTTPGGSWAATFPSAASLYGGAAGLEQVSAAFDNYDAPGMPTRNSTTKLPTSMTVSLANRTVTGTVPTTEGGAMGVFITYAYTDGSPAKRTLLPYYVAPAVQDLASGWTYAPGDDVDVTIPFTAFHSGNLGPHTYEVTAPGLTVTGNGTGAVQITGTASATSTITIAATNIQGQTTTVARPLTVEAVPDPGTPTPYADWTGPGWFDMSDAATITLSGSQVTTVANKRSGGGDLTAAGTVANVVRQTAAQNGRQAVRINRISDAGINTPRLEASATSPVSALFQGNDSPFTVIMAYRPNDANTGFIWSATAGSGADTDQTIALVRRTTNASIRRKPLLVSNDVNWGTGQAANVARIVAIRHTGTTVTVWDNSLTKILTDAPQDAEAFTALLQFTLGASRSNNVSYAGVQATTDYFEAILESTVRSDADVQQAITDLAAKWGITLT